MGEKTTDWEEKVKEVPVLTKSEQKNAKEMLDREEKRHRKKFDQEWSPEFKENFKRLLPFRIRYGYGPKSHHPPCYRFRNHTVKVGKYRYCIGCYVGYTSGVLGLILAIVLQYAISGVYLNPYVFLGIGLAFWSAQLLSLISASEIHAVKITQKALIGFGGAWVVFFTFLIIPSHIVVKIIVALIVMSVLLLPVKILHVRKTRDICKNCKWYKNDSVCPDRFKPERIYSEKDIRKNYQAVTQKRKEYTKEGVEKWVEFYHKA